MGYRAFARGQGGSPELLSRSLRPARSGKPVHAAKHRRGKRKRQGRQRARFFDDARGSAAECAACLDVLVAKRILAAERIDEGKAMLLRIVSMLSKLGERFDNSYDRLREDEAKYPRPSSAYSCSSSMAKGGFEHEDDGRERGRGGET